jgi:hypothetical protein
MKAFVYIVLPLLALVAIVTGCCSAVWWATNYWINVEGRPNALARTEVVFEDVGTLEILYPESIRLNTNMDRDIEFEFKPLATLTDTVTLTIQLEQSSPYITLDQYKLDMIIDSTSPQQQTVKVTPRDLRLPPASLTILLNASTTGFITSSKSETISIPVDNWTWRLATGATIVVGILSFFGVIVGIFKK